LKSSVQTDTLRGISITSSVLQFGYEGAALNLLDTPGHADFSEDTYRTLAAVDSAVMLIDHAKGVEERTRRLLAVKGRRTVTQFHRELGKLMWEHCGMGRNRQGLESALQMIPELRERFWKEVLVPGVGEDLNQSLEQAGRVVDVLIEVDLTGERSGVTPEGLPAFADLVARLDGLRLRGLMTLPPIPERPEDARPWFARLRELRERLARTHPQVVDLSMGMSLDYAVAVEEGATMVRIGTALFGPRTA